MSHDRDDPVNRKMYTDHDAQRRRLYNDPGGTAYTARNLARAPASVDYTPGPYDPSRSVRDDWRGIFGRMSETELEAERDKAEDEWEFQLLSEHPDEWKKGFSRMQLDLIEERLREIRGR